MGRGRAKAKQAKVARQLKYNIPDMDLDSLQRELSGKKTQPEDDASLEDDYADWAEWAEKYNSADKDES